MTTNATEEIETHVERLGLVLKPDGETQEVDGVLNPAAARAPDGELLLYPRVVADGNISRIGRVLVRCDDDEDFYSYREGYALEPEAEYELRPHPGYGCEDPRTTFVAALKLYVMAYTAFGPPGPRIAIAVSSNAREWRRIGLMRFDKPGMHVGDDKDAAFFPEPVLSPAGVLSLAFYHRPMLHISAVDGHAAMPMIERLPFEDRESIRMGYVPLEPVLRDIDAILDVHESVLVMSPNANWGSIKIGAGTPPVRIAEGWMSLFHGVDVIDDKAVLPKFRYCAGIVIHDLKDPSKIVYRSPKPILVPESDLETFGTVDNVVFPTGIDVRADLGARVFDVYYGMADYTIGAARLTLD